MDGIELVVLDNWLAVLGKSIFNQIEKKKKLITILVVIFMVNVVFQNIPQPL